MYVLVDSNNFFVSCERLFRPELQHVPVVVLSSNDGCAVSRSNEAKALGIQMGEPLHLLRERFTVRDGTRADNLGALITDTSAEHSVERPSLVVFSANFSLYGAISRRIGDILTEVTPRLEFYSIDEAFLDVHQLVIEDYEQWGRTLSKRILREVGIPVSVGIAPTKTLCKLANRHAKQHLVHHSTFIIRPTDLAHPSTLAASSTHPAPPACSVLATTEIGDLWGIGRRLAPRLRAEGIHTANDLARLRPRRAQQLIGIQGRRIVAELNGISCIPLQVSRSSSQIISRGRQFGKDTRDPLVVSAAVAHMTSRAALALRRENLITTHAAVRLSTNRQKPGYTALSCEVTLTTPTSDTGLISHCLLERLRQQVDNTHSWHKAEVTLWGLSSAASLQPDLFGHINPARHHRSQRLMATLDTLAARFGHGVVRYATEELSHDWQPRCQRASPNYLASWHELPLIQGRRAA